MGGSRNSLETSVNTALNLSGISVFDADGDDLEITLTANNGTLTFTDTTGLSFSDGDGTDDAVVTFSGSLSDLNAALTLFWDSGRNPDRG